MHKLHARARVLYCYVAGAICVGFSTASIAVGSIATGSIAKPAGAITSLRPIRVRVLRSQKIIEIDGFNLSVNGQRVLQTILPVHSSARIERNGGLWIIHAGLNEIRSNANHLVVTGDMLKMAGHLQPRAIMDLEARFNRFDVVENLSIEEYLQGVLPNEMPINWPIAALEAQAIASISYARAQAFARADEGFDVDNTVESQVFDWQTYSHLTFKGRRKLARILLETRGRLLVSRGGKPYLAYFHSDCGGETELPQNVWGHDAPRGAVVHDSYCLLNRHNRWKLRVTRSELQTDLQVESADMREHFHGAVRDIKIVSYSPSGRAEQLALVTDNGSLMMNGQNFRRMIGYARLKSTLFSISRVADGFEFDGRGFGHGVGLCQHGARFMAMNGSSFAQILSHYYPLARLIDLDRVPPHAPVSTTVVAQSN